MDREEQVSDERREPRIRRDSRLVLPPDQGELLKGRRTFLTGSLGITAFAATLHTRRAFAGNGNSGQCNWISCDVQTACSPHPSATQVREGCTAYHCDHYCFNTNNWPCNVNTTFAECGFTPPTGCGVSGSSRLVDCLTPAYQQNGQNKYCYNTACNTSGSSQALGCWFATGCLNALTSPSQFGYTCRQFSEACQAAYSQAGHYCSTTTIGSILCKSISSSCPTGYQPSGCSPGSPSCFWV